MAPPRTCSRCGSTTNPPWTSEFCPVCALEYGLRGYETPDAESEVAPQPGQDGLPTFAGYQLLGEIGSGGMGVVYRALHIRLNRRVALKRIRPEVLARNEDRHRFRTEAETAARLRHPNIVTIFEVGEFGSQPFYTMELVEGTVLSSLLRNGPLDPLRAARYILAAAQAMHHAHQQGVLHRDLKPSNLIIDSEDRPRILDFGLAKFLSADSEFTLAGAVLGSPSYMPPEQASASHRQADPRSDVYSLGAILYELITGRAPFCAATPLETLSLVRDAEPVPPRRLSPRLPRDLETICLKCLSKSPDHRYASAEALARDLQRFLDREPIRARPVGPIARFVLWSRRKPAIAALAVGMVILLVIGTTGILLAWHQEHRQRLRAEAGERMARLNRYAVDMNLALQAVEDGQDGRARDILATYSPPSAPVPAPQPGSFAPLRPGSATLPLADGQRFDPRGFEWRHLWHASRADPHRSLVGHSAAISGLALSPDGRTIFSAGFDGVFRAQSLEGIPVFALSNLGGLHPSSLALHPADGRIALGADPAHDGFVFDAAGTRLLTLPRGFNQQVHFSPDGQWILSGALAGWITTTGSTAILNLKGQAVRWLTNAGARCCFAPNGTRFATGSAQGRILIWSWSDPSDAAPPNPVLLGDLGPVGPLRSMTFSPDGKRLATCDGSGDWKVWDVDQRTLIRSVTAAPNAGLLTLAYSPDGHSLAAGGEDRRLRIWDAESFTLKSVHRGHLSSIWTVAWTSDSTSVISGGADGLLAVWPAQPPPPREIILSETTSDYFHSSLAFSPDSRWLSATLTGGRFGIWDARSGGLSNQIPVGPDPLHATFSADSTAVAVAFGYREIRRYSVPALAELGRTPLEKPTTQVRVAGPLSAEGRWLAGIGGSAEDDGAIQLWNAVTGKRAATLRGHTRRVQGLRFSPDNRWLASGSADETARVWDLETFRETAVLRGSANAITVLAFSPDGRTLATGGWDGALRLWRLPTGEAIAAIPHWDGTPVPEFMPDGTSLAVMVEQTGVRLYHLEAQRDTCTLRWPGARPYRYLRCSPDGSVIAAHSQDGRIKLWHAPPADDLAPSSQASAM